MNIYQAGLEDLNDLAHLFDGYRVFYEQESDMEAAKAFLRDRIEKEESVIFISRNEGGQATGFTQLYPLFSSTRMKRLWVLNDLYVAPEFRGMGFSKALIERAKQLCKDTVAAGMYLETAKKNHIGNQLYPRTGWTLDEEHNYYFWESSRW
ncbi:MAG: GNAT family N-acetyltransferase [Balneola sp.]|nr:MAG: GNAT family N-acetyltransferase [Balneola sp.]